MWPWPLRSHAHQHNPIHNSSSQSITTTGQISAVHIPAGLFSNKYTTFLLISSPILQQRISPINAFMINCWTRAMYWSENLSNSWTETFQFLSGSWMHPWRQVTPAYSRFVLSLHTSATISSNMAPVLEWSTLITSPHLLLPLRFLEVTPVCFGLDWAPAQRNRGVCSVSASSKLWLIGYHGGLKTKVFLGFHKNLNKQ